MQCLDGNELVDFAEGRLPDDRVRSVDEHLDVCASCRQVAAELVRSGTASTAEARPDVPDLIRGDTLDRFHIVQRLGAGAMGIVYAAYDPTLDRRCALKLLRPELLPSDTAPAATARLMTEARLLARLNHPNVVAVHEVGASDGQMFLVMELVDGENLTTWLAHESRGWRDVVRAFIAAAEGLAAAHALGVVHRDFKPDNVLVGRDGRVRVSDFGLARLQVGAEPRTRPDDTPTSVDPYLTRTGAILGTPAYLAPEVLDGADATPASDQFAFCVALVEALERARPFTGHTLQELRSAHRRGWRPREQKTPGGRLPSWLTTVLRRGLSESPAARFESMAALADKLRSGVAPRRLVGTAAVVIAALLVVGSSALWMRRATVCSGASASLNPVWNPDAREAIRKALRQSGATYAESTLRVVEQGLDRYARAWIAASVDACQATQVRAEQDEETLARRVQCLEDHRTQFGAVVEVLARIEAATAERAIHTLDALGDLSRCEDAEHLSRQPVVLDAVAKNALVTVVEDTSRARALHALAQYDEAMEIAVRAVQGARAQGNRAAEAQALEVLGVLQQFLKKGADAEATLLSAVLAAEASDQDHLAALAWVRLIHARGVANTDAAGAEQADAHARALISRLQDDELEAHRLFNLAAVRIIERRYEDARRLYEDALKLRERLHEGPHVAMIASIVGIADATMMMGRYADAIPLYERARSMFTTLVGPDHPNVANVLHNLGTTLTYAGEHERARQMLNEAIALREKALGKEHALLCSSYSSLGIAHTYGGDADAGVASMQYALSICDKALGADHASTTRTVSNLAEALLSAGRAAEALPLFRRAVATREKQLGGDHPTMSYPLAGLGDALRHSGHAKEAIPILERAVRLTDRPDRGAGERALVQLRLAKAIWHAGDDRPRAVRVAKAARALLEGRPPKDVAAVVKEIDAWLQQTRAR